MSLLMDALKKAEEEKKKAAAAVPAEEEGAGETLGSGTVPEGMEAGGDSTGTISQERLDLEASELSLEPIEEGLPGEEQESVPPSEEPTESNLELERTQIEPFEGGEESTVTSQRRLETGEYDQESTLPSERTIKSSLDDYFEASQSMRRPGVAAAGEETARQPIDTGIGEVTQGTAQTIFAAGRGRGGSALKWAAFLVLVLALTLGAAGFYYYLQTPNSSLFPAPRVATTPAVPAAPPVTEAFPEETLAEAREVVAQASLEHEPPEESTAPVEIPEPSASPAETAQIATSSPAEETEEPAALAPTAASVAGSAQPVVAEPVAETEERTPVQEPGTPEAPPVAAEFSQLAQVAAEPAPAADIKPLVLRPRMLQITRSKPAPEVDRRLELAYSAWQTGDMRQAARLYREVLKSRPGERDALLGLAAIALREGDLAGAHEYYRQVLSRDPKDPVASAGLFAIEGGVEGASVSEARLKMLLRQVPHAAHIHFSLGTLYARQQRWPEAQEAFFNAFSADSANPDYAYNLAVSLDRLHQYRAALQYYRRALDLSASRPAAFDRMAARARVATLGGLASNG